MRRKQKSARHALTLRWRKVRRQTEKIYWRRNYDTRSARYETDDVAVLIEGQRTVHFKSIEEVEAYIEEREVSKT